VRECDLNALNDLIESRGGFGHREHLELAWDLLHRYSVNEASDVMADLIRDLALRHGAADKYHETITRTWLQCVAVHTQRWDADTFETFIERNPDLLNRDLLNHFYSRELIKSDTARADWAVPDIRQLPALA
jgi:hypothetical protein